MRLKFLVMGTILALPFFSTGEEPPSPIPAEQVFRLIRQLDADERSTRDRAEEGLGKLGAAVLPHLTDLDSDRLSAEQRRRLERLLPKLWKAKLDKEVAGSLVSLGPEPAPLRKILQAIEERTGNRINIRAGIDPERAEAAISLPLQKVPFWQALDRIAEKAGISYYFYTVDRSVEVVCRPASPCPVSYAGVFRLQANKISLRRELTSAASPAVCLLELELLVEPRFRPLLVELDTRDLSITDDTGRKLEFIDRRTYTMVLEQDSYHLPLVLSIQAPERSATKIEELTGQLQVWLPAHVSEVEFEKLRTNQAMASGNAGVRVRISSITDEDGVWIVPLSIKHLAQAAAVDSYLQDALEPELHLERADGTRFEQNGGMSTLGDGFEYEFVDAPGKLEDYRLVVRIPTGITQIPVRFRFQDLLLP